LKGSVVSEIAVPNHAKIPWGKNIFHVFPFSVSSSILFFFATSHHLCFHILSCLLAIILFLFAFLGFLWFVFVCFSDFPFSSLLVVAFVTNCHLYSIGRRSVAGAPKRDSGEAFTSLSLPKNLH
jgi:hypothetical protein